MTCFHFQVYLGEDLTLCEHLNGLFGRLNLFERFPVRGYRH